MEAKSAIWRGFFAYYRPRAVILDDLPIRPAIIAKRAGIEGIRSDECALVPVWVKSATSSAAMINNGLDAALV